MGTVVRTISRTNAVIEGHPALSQNYTATKFRPVEITETLRHFTNSDGSIEIDYRVTTHGPALTKTGKEHAMNRGKRTWSGRWGEGTVPETLQPYLIGRDAMLAEIGRPS